MSDTPYDEEIGRLSNKDSELKTAQLDHLRAKTRLLVVQAKNAEETDRWNEIQLKRRVYTITDGIDPSDAYNYRTTVTKWLDFDSTVPIQVLIHSGGGEVFSGLAIYDFTKEVIDQGAIIHTKVLGWAASMAGILVQMGTERSITPNSHIMVHEAATLMRSSMTASQMKDQSIFIDKLQARCLDILASKSRLSAEDIAEKSYRTNWYLNAEEALEAGFVDKIIGCKSTAEEEQELRVPTVFIGDPDEEDAYPFDWRDDEDWDGDG